MSPKKILTLPAFKSASLILLALSFACAEARPAGSAPDTDLSVVDEGGASVPGLYELWSPAAKDSCETSGSSCSVSLPAGDYNLSFTKERSGRVAQSTGGNIGGDRGSGCLRARVHLVPGRAISCKKTSEYNCAKGALETMDCGASSSARAGSYAPAQAMPASTPAAPSVAPAPPPTVAPTAPVVAPAPAGSPTPMK